MTECPAECKVQLQGIMDKIRGHERKIATHDSKILSAHGDCVQAITRIVEKADQDCKERWEHCEGRWDTMDEGLKERPRMKSLQWVAGMCVGVLLVTMGGMWTSHNRLATAMENKMDDLSTTMTRVETQLIDIKGHTAEHFDIPESAWSDFKRDHEELRKLLMKPKKNR